MIYTKKIDIVIADDCIAFCDILNNYLSKQKDIVVTGIANNGIELLQLIQEKKPDLVILDIIMPHLNGLEVLERLDTMDVNPMPRIIAISAIREERITQKALSLGVEHYIVKPFELDVFIKIIRQMFLNKSMKITTIGTLINIYSINNSLEEDYNKKQELISIALLKHYHNHIVNNPYNDGLNKNVILPLITCI